MPRDSHYLSCRESLSCREIVTISHAERLGSLLPRDVVGSHLERKEPIVEVRLERDLKVPLAFEGWLLAEVSTHIPGKERWTELRIWAVDPENTETMWVLETVGRSEVPGEKDRRDGIPCETFDELVASLSRHGQLTAPGRTVLEMAAREDDELRYAFDNPVKKETERL